MNEMFIYVVGDEAGTMKVGITRRSAYRLTELRRETGRQLITYLLEPAVHRNEALDIERMAHARLAEHRAHGEWFMVSSEEAINTVQSCAVAVRSDPNKRFGYPEMPWIMIAADQIRAARALIGWTQAELAEASDKSIMSIKNIERGATDPKASTLQAIQDALEKAGVIFLDAGVNRDGGRGVRLK